MRIVHSVLSLLVLACACTPDQQVSSTAAALSACPDVCLFGEVFSDIRTSPVLTIESEEWVRDASALDPLTAEQLLHAVQQSSHDDVTTAAEALSRVDQAEVRIILFHDEYGAFAVYEYGVGDNSYGAYFARDSAEVLASIHDGDILDCTVFAP